MPKFGGIELEHVAELDKLLGEPQPRYQFLNPEAVEYALKALGIDTAGGGRWSVDACEFAEKLFEWLRMQPCSRAAMKDGQDAE